MFLVNRLFGLNGPSPAPELMTIDGGRLFLVRPDSIKGSRECIFIDASISIRRTTHPFNYQLVVTRTFQDGEEQLLEEDAENSDERAFLLHPDLFLSLGPALDSGAESDLPGPQLSFTWADPDGDQLDEFEFTLSPADSATTAPGELERLAWRCLWEREEGRDWPTDPAEARMVEETLESSFKTERAAPPPSAPHNPTTPAKSKTPLFRPPSPDSSDDEAPPVPSSRAPLTRDDSVEPESDSDDDDGEDLAAQLVGKLSLSDKKGKGKAEPSSPLTELPIAPPLVKPPTSVAPESVATSAAIVEGRGSLHMYDSATGLFMPQEGDVEVALHRTQTGFWLVVVGAHCVWVSQGLELDLPINCSLRDLSIVFNFRPDVEEGAEEDEYQQVFTWLVKFPDEDSFNAMQRGVAEAQYELKWGQGSWKKLKEDERDYQKTAYIEDAEMYSIDENGPDEEGDEVVEEEEESEEESDEENDPEDERKFAPKAYKAKNTQLAVGYKDGMSYVVQGDMIGVFRQGNDKGKKLDFVTSIVGVAGPDGRKNFTPQQLMLHNQDTEMILQNPNDAGSLFRMDLEIGKVVEEYKVSDDFAVNNFIPDSKFAQMTQQKTFIGTSSNGIFRIDPRLSGSKLVDSEFKQYATKADFSVAATTESGRLAVASNKGDIRLFDKLGKNAKTVLPALGDAIVGLDVSADGRWVLATCKTYLLLVDTLIPEGAGRYGGSSGFDRSFPAAQKPTAKRLTLKAEHQALMSKESKSGVSFGKAKFNTAPGSLERTIVVSTGPFIVAWNFRQVKAGKFDEYILRRFSDTVVADNFQFGGDRKIVTTPGNIFVEDKKKLKAPTRDSIAHIVKHWDG